MWLNCAWPGFPVWGIAWTLMLSNTTLCFYLDGWLPKKLTKDTCLPMGIDLRHDAGKSDNLLLVWYWAAHSWKVAYVLCSRCVQKPFTTLDLIALTTFELILHSQLFTMRGCIVLCTQDNIIRDMIGLINLKNNYDNSRACHNLTQKSLLLHMLYLGAI